MITEIKKQLKPLEILTTKEKVYAGTVFPFWVAFTIYMLIGVPIFV